MRNTKIILFLCGLLVGYDMGMATNATLLSDIWNTDNAIRSLTTEQQASIDQVTTILAERNLEADPVTDAEIKKWMDTMNPDGSWDDGKYGQMNAAGNTAPNRSFKEWLLYE